LEKFFSLPVEKQNTIIDAALASFGANGYKKASISDIATAAGISKSMVFHYFGTKKDLYLYLIDLCINILTNEINEKFDSSITDFFDRIKLSTNIEISAMKKHPAMLTFFNSVNFENDDDVKDDIKIAFINSGGETIRSRIAFEGMDGAGKGTQSKLLCDYLKYKNSDSPQFNPIFVSFPFYRLATASIIRDKYLQGEFAKFFEGEELSRIVSEFYALNRFEAFYSTSVYDNSKALIDYYNEGKLIISDRYVYSNVIHQGTRIKDLKEFIQFVKVPDFRGAEGVQIDRRELGSQVAKQFLVPFQFQRRVIAALEQNLIASQGDGFLDLPVEFLTRQYIRVFVR
jgi:AcrR family transcriptional regulator